MVNTRKATIRERTRLRRSQNPQQIDFKKMRKARAIRTQYWAMKGKGRSVPATKDEKEKAKDKSKQKDKPKKEKKPELEVIDDDINTTTIDDELDEIYSLDDEDTE